MKISYTIYLLAILAFSFASSAKAAKENFDRSKPHLQKVNQNHNSCNSQNNTQVCTSKQLVGNLGASNSTGVKAQDYNSSRSNRRGMKQGGNDLVLRKRPGRSQFTPSENCPKQQKNKQNNFNPSCVAR